MPSWYIKHSPNTITAPEKEQLAKSITRLYVSHGLPAFYVQVHFIENIPGTSFVGGEPHPNFAALTIYHIARAFKTDEAKRGFLAAVDEILNPFFEPKGMNGMGVFHRRIVERLVEDQWSCAAAAWI
ncbi:unnamed protein product [Penicillium camemberti]|uniref:Str. FM013 n=1 Tax=Penicillium camemberti (strain FM 013) TaxID=1429867 RepID=A0A0G4PA96_PENC3|nr:unnamed protein product [Penicillium camemberti]